jgi:N-acyl-D-aspartate/D-glutamate deacylase
MPGRPPPPNPVPSSSAFTLLVAAVCISLFGSVHAEQFNLVLHGGRVIDPESGLDAVRDIGISGDKILSISATPLSGDRILDVSGLVVAPGFIDVHQHDQDADSTRLKAFDGVTTALEMEIGVPDVETFLREKYGHSLINYGTSASHGAARARAFGAPLPAGTILPRAGPASNDSASSAQVAQIRDRLVHELDAGALGVGIGIQYTPGATRSEIIQMFRLAAERHVPVFTHVRSSGPIEPGSSVESISEVIGAAAITGASLQIVHVNSSCLKDAPECLEMIAGARARGLDVTVEAYPYVAGMTYISSALFNPGWQQKLGVSYAQLVIPETGEHLTKERFDQLHNSGEPRRILEYLNTDEIVDQIIVNPLVMIASDGEHEHPRNAGTYSRILSRYVRELRTVTLIDAIRKMSLMPAQRLEKATVAARYKGRLQAGADADIVAFDLSTVSDRSTYQNPMTPSIGMRYVIVNGVVLIDQGRLLPNTFPGRALMPRQSSIDQLPGSTTGSN